MTPPRDGYIYDNDPGEALDGIEYTNKQSYRTRLGDPVTTVSLERRELARHLGLRFRVWPQSTYAVHRYHIDEQARCYREVEVTEFGTNLAKARHALNGFRITVQKQIV